MGRGYDVVLVGGGLQNALIALAIRSFRPRASIAWVERDERLGGNHTWCFHARDVPSEAAPLIAPLVVRSWSGYDVRFPDYRRSLRSRYAAIDSDRLDAHLQGLARTTEAWTLCLGVAAVSIDDEEVALEDGRTLRGRLIIDARGPAELLGGRVGGSLLGSSGYQKFLGWDVLLERPHGLREPLLMDATVEQHDGYRFFYLLPLSDDRVLVEETRFSDSAELDRSSFRDGIAGYIERLGWSVGRRLREERGVLPMPWRVAAPQVGMGPLRGGYAGGWFHPATGYSFPAALRLALLVAKTPPGRLWDSAVTDLRRRHNRQARFCAWLNDLLFRWYEPADRWHIFSRFYRLPESTIERFFALEMTSSDLTRLLGRRPPRGFSLGARWKRWRAA